MDDLYRDNCKATISWKCVDKQRQNLLQSETCEKMVRLHIVRYETLRQNIKQVSLEVKTFEPRHDRTNKVTVRPAKTQFSLGTRPVWSESSLSAWRKLESWATQWAHNEDSDAQAELSLRWAHSHFVGFVMSWLIFICRKTWFIVWSKTEWHHFCNEIYE